MQVSVEKVSNTERRLTVVVPEKRVEEAFAKQISAFAKKADIKGFRPGKAPLSYIQKRFGNDARAQALNDVIQESFYQALAENNLRPVSAPKIEPKMMSPNQPLEYVASFEVLPEIGTVNFSLAAIDKFNAEVKEEDIQRVLTQLRKQYTKWKVVDRPARNHDRVVLDYYAIFEGKSDEENKVQNFPLELGSNVMLPGFEEGLLEAKTGDERTLNLQFPADFKDETKAGKPVAFVVTVKQVLEADMPVMDEAFIKGLGVRSGKEDDLKNQIQKTLEQERDRLVNEKLKEQVFNALVEQNPIDVPHSLVAREAQKIHDEIYQQQHHDHGSHAQDELDAFNNVAKKRVSLGLLIAEYAKQTKLKVDKNRVHKRIEEIASVYEKPQEVINYLANGEQRNGIEAQVMEDQVLEKLMEGIPMNEKIISYAELKGIRV